ncbi:MAG: helix-turn-helix domain-containing protein [Pirellulales bacterium]
MKKNSTQPHAYSVCQVAKRWGISPDRVRQLIDAGRLPGTFRIPSAGRFGMALRIPAETVFQAEREWEVGSPLAGRVERRRRRSSCELTFRHFPELAEDDLQGDEER